MFTSTRRGTPVVALAGPALAFIAALSGCQSPRVDSGRMAVESTAAPTSPFTGLDTIRKSPDARAYRSAIVGAEDELVITRAAQADGTVIVRELPRIDGKDRPDLASELVQTLDPATGRTELVRTVEHADAVTTQFNPPLVVIPDALVLGQSHQQKLHMIVRPIDHPDKVRTEGDATSTLTFEAEEVVVTPAGRFMARRIRSTLNAKLGPATVVTVTDAWYGPPGVGMVAEHRTERASTFGVTVRSVDKMWVLATK